jgi:hypothetical protein
VALGWPPRAVAHRGLFLLNEKRKTKVAEYYTYAEVHFIARLKVGYEGGSNSVGTPNVEQTKLPEDVVRGKRGTVQYIKSRSTEQRNLKLQPIGNGHHRISSEPESDAQIIATFTLNRNYHPDVHKAGL